MLEFSEELGLIWQPANIADLLRSPYLLLLSPSVCWSCLAGQAGRGPSIFHIMAVSIGLEPLPGTLTLIMYFPCPLLPVITHAHPLWHMLHPIHHTCTHHAHSSTRGRTKTVTS